MSILHKLMVVGILCLLPYFILAQQPIQVIEGGCDVFTPIAVGGNLGGKQTSVGTGIRASLRYNFPKSKWDIGISYQYSIMTRVLECAQFPASNETFLNRDCRFENSTLYLTSGYNFKQRGKINPYISLGIGISSHSCNISGINTSISPAIIPEVGVEIFHGMRLNFKYAITRRCFNQIELGVGFAIGGRLKLSKPDR